MSRLAVVFLVVVLAIPQAFANGAMGLGLEQWDPTVWMVYVVAMTAVEAWLMGRWLGLGIPESIVVSILANLMTGVGCGLMGCMAPFLHYPLVGSTADPNPLLSALALLALFAIPSALFEGIFWDRMYRKGRKNQPGGQGVLGRLLLIHLALVPVGMAILLIPDRPYLGYEAFARGARQYELRLFADDLSVYTYEKHHLPAATTVESLLKEVPHFTLHQDRKRSNVFLHVPVFGRFAAGNESTVPYRLNKAIAGMKVDPEADYDEPQWEWYIEPPNRDSWGIRVELQSGAFEFVRDSRLKE